MAIALVGSVGAVQTFTIALTGDSIVVNLAQASTAGNLLVIAVAMDLGSGTVDLSGNASWTGTSTVICVGAGVGLTYFPNCTGGLTSATFTGLRDAESFRCVPLEFSGVATVTPKETEGRNNQATGSPVVATSAAIDAAAGNLVFGAGVSQSSKAGTTTTTVAFNNGATSNAIDNDDAVSQVNHHRIAYGITTGNASADTATFSDAGMNLNGAGVSSGIWSFQPPIVPNVALPRQRIGGMAQAVHQAAVRCQTYRRKSGILVPRLWTPAPA